jgi:hypothetical protein
MHETGMVIAERIAELKALLETASRENELQTFLEKNPWLLLRSEAVGNLVISQLPLGPDHRCDFAMFYQRSGGNVLQLVEIESPTLRIFNATDEFSQHFNHSVQQLDDWSAWCRRSKDHLDSVLEPLFDDGYLDHLPNFDRIHLWLIAGRRSQISNAIRKRRWEERVNNAPKPLEIRTWDGFVSSLPMARFQLGGTDTACLRYSKQSYSKL